MKLTQSSHITNRATSPEGCSAFGLPFGAIKWPGPFYGRMSQRSCRWTRAHRRGGCVSALAYTNMPGSHTYRLMVAALRATGMVSGFAHPLLDGGLGRASALSVLLCGIRGTQTLAFFGYGTACPFGGPDASRRSVAFAMTSHSRQESPLAQGYRALLPSLECDVPPLFS